MNCRLSALNSHKILHIHYLTNRKDTNVINVIMMQCASAPSNKKSTTAANKKKTNDEVRPSFVCCKFNARHHARSQVLWDGRQLAYMCRW